MRILHVLEATLGGTARHIIDLCQGLLDRGHEVHLLYSARRASQAFLEELAGLRSAAGFHAAEIPMRREISWEDWRHGRAIRAYVCSRGPFDVIHAHSTKAGFLTRLAVGDRGVVRIYTPHGWMTQDPRMPAWKRLAVSALEASLARRSDAIIAVSEKERRCGLRTGIPAHKLAVVPNGLRPQPLPDRQTARRELGVAPDTVMIASIGLLVPNKEPLRLLEAFAQLRRSARANVALYIAGWGPLEAELRARLHQLGLGGAVRLLGPAPGHRLLAAADVLAHASRYEGFGYVFLEALAAGVPVVTTDVGGAREAVIPGLTGFLCDPWDPAAFAGRLRQLAEDPGLRAHMGAAARRHFAHFRLDRMIEATLQVYGQLAATPQTAFVPRTL
jgi:glycosyltransferase involved in cell wall biosynthesis